jgi:hypothetical protein
MCQYSKCFSVQCSRVCHEIRVHNFCAVILDVETFQHRASSEARTPCWFTAISTRTEDAMLVLSRNFPNSQTSLCQVDTEGRTEIPTSRDSKYEIYFHEI